MNAPMLRFKADDGSEFLEWTKVSFGSLIREYVDKTKEENEDVLLSCAIEGVFLNSELFGHQRGESNVGYKKIQNNTLILSTQNLHLGNANVNRRFIHGIISPAYKTYHVVGCLPEFMAIWVKRPAAKRFFYEATTVGASQCRRNVVWDELYAQTLSLPSLLEQRKIATFLSTIDDIITATQSELLAWQERKEGVMQKIFNREVRFKADDGSEFPEWEEKRLGEVCDIVGGGTPDTDKAEYWGGDVNWFTPSEIGETKYVVKSNRQISKLGLLKSSAKLLPQGTILLTSRATLGEMAIVKQECCTNQGFQSLIVKQECLNEFIYYYQPVIKRYCEKHASGSTFLEISKKEISGCKLGVPSLPEQRKIAECLSSLDDVINQIDAELSAWKEFKKGLLQQMFV